MIFCPDPEADKKHPTFLSDLPYYDGSFSFCRHTSRLPVKLYPTLFVLLNPKSHIKKTYRARLARPLDGSEGERFASGQLVLEGEDKPLAPAELTVISDTEAVLVVTEGRYHQVRRMFAATGNHVLDLHREQLGGLTLPADMAPGAWRLLHEEEIALIFQ